MARPDKYVLRDGSVVPGTTTVIDGAAPAEALWKWIGKQNRIEEDLATIAYLCRQIGAWNTPTLDAIDVAAAAATPGIIGEIAAIGGTWGHGLIEQAVSPTGISPIPQPADARLPEHGGNRRMTREEYHQANGKAWCAVSGFKAWENATGPYAFLAQEVPLVCDCHGYGGTFDALAVSGIKDWKTGKRLYPKHRIQLGAYTHLVEHGYPTLDPEHKPEWLGETVESGTILRVGDAPYQYETIEMTRDDLLDAFAVFESMLTVYRWKKS